MQRTSPTQLLWLTTGCEPCSTIATQDNIQFAHTIMCVDVKRYICVAIRIRSTFPQDQECQNILCTISRKFKKITPYFPFRLNTFRAGWYVLLASSASGSSSTWHDDAVEEQQSKNGYNQPTCNMVIFRSEQSEQCRECLHIATFVPMARGHTETELMLSHPATLCVLS